MVPAPCAVSGATRWRPNRESLTAANTDWNPTFAKDNPYTDTSRPTRTPPICQRDIKLVALRMLEHGPGDDCLRCCDPTAGGGSIPYEAVRYRLPAHANDLNPVAAAVLRAGVELPARYGIDLIPGPPALGQVACNSSPDFKDTPCSRTFLRLASDNNYELHLRPDRGLSSHGQNRATW